MKLKLLCLLIVFALTPGSVALAQENEKNEKTSGNFFTRLSFEESTFVGKIDASVVSFAASIEDWRGDRAEKYSATIDKVANERIESKDDSKPATKIMSFLHLVLLSVLIFFFSVKTVFYAVIVIVALSIVRRVLGKLFSLFGRHPD